MSRITLAAVGDISLARQVEKTIKGHDVSHLLEKVKPALDQADVRFGNLESVAVPENFPLEQASGIPLYSYDAALEALRPAGFDILHSASNHVLDCGWRGLLHTYERIQAIGARPLGTGCSQNEARALRIVEKNGIKLGFLGYLQAGDWTLEGGGGRIAYLKLEDVAADIEKHRSTVDVLVISIHGDIEFQPAPSLPRLNLCRKIAEAGADLILCHHPHVPQGVEKWGNCLIHYSLGNFIFDPNGYQTGNSPNVVKSHIFYVDIEDGRIAGWRRKYLRIDLQEGRPHPLAGEECREEDRYYLGLDEILKNPYQLRDLWHTNCLRRLSWMIDRIRNSPSLTPESFLQEYGKLLFSDMSHEYLDGLYELAYQEYRKNAYNDFELKRPYAPYE
ncbi:MAG: Capsule biosynthesis protein CapA [Lentisphaerae bacterium ADurb.Bin242]|nr:MAG: Capsule biosynthesis protein CapA [Lentisphaerae bacterium ADurb.Bin242]